MHRSSVPGLLALGASMAFWHGAVPQAVGEDMGICHRAR